MLYFLTCLFTIYFEESFNTLDISQWKNQHSSNYTISECSASHPNLVHNCLYVSKPNEKLTLTSELENTVKKSPLLIFFTTRSTLPTSESKLSLSLFSNSQKAFSVGFNFNKYAEYFLNDANDKNLSSGVIQHESFLTHSITMIFRGDTTYEFYVDGLILGNGKLTNAFPLTNIEFNIETNNNTIQVGNILITSSVKQKWPVLISNLLRYRDIERSVYVKSLVDDYENDLFEGVPFKGKLDLEEEEGKLLNEDEADPRRFNFPFKINNKNENEDPAAVERKKKKDKETKVEEFEEHEEYDQIGSDL